MAEPAPAAGPTTKIIILAEKTITPLPINLRIKADTPLAHSPLIRFRPGIKYYCPKKHIENKQNNI